MANHLGNVLVTVSDKKIGHDAGNGTIDYYNADVVTAQDYYVFGGQMPGRKYQQGTNSYRYGFNGKENDNEVKGEGNQYDYGFRIYDTRIGRFLSVDPLYKSFAMLTPYQFASNTPIAAIDLDGLEAKIVTTYSYINSKGTTIRRITENDVKNPYNLGKGVLNIAINYVTSNVANTEAKYTPQSFMSKVGDFFTGNFEGGKNEFGFILKGNSNGTSVDVGSDGVKFKETLDIGILLKVMSAVRDVTDEKSTITEFMTDKKIKGFYNIIKSTMKLGDVLSSDEEKLSTDKPKTVVQNKSARGKWQYSDQDGGANNLGNSTAIKPSNDPNTPDTMIITNHTPVPKPSKKKSY